MMAAMDENETDSIACEFVKTASTSLGAGAQAWRESEPDPLTQDGTLSPVPDIRFRRSPGFTCEFAPRTIGREVEPVHSLYRHFLSATLFKP
jgi:hypothetical protein